MSHMSLKQIKFFNTLSRSLEVFEPQKPAAGTDGAGADKCKVGFYSCGPTVYSKAHIGNMRAFIFADVVARTLRFAGYNLHHVMNITDVGHLTDDGNEGEDKLEVGARREGLTAWQVAEKYTEFFFDQLDLLGLQRADTICKATDHIKEQIAMVEKLESNGFTYNTSDGVYFDTEKFGAYGAMALLDKDGMEAGHRVELGEKKSKTDFALWKLSPKDEKRAMEWDSPWGVGFPGWHIECSAMSSRYLGDSFDIHTGGVDHIPVHHTNEIAQAECSSGVSPFVKYWMHCEFLILDDGTKKMSKSIGNIITISDLKEQGYHPLAFKYLCLQTHYRKQLRYSETALKASQTAYRKLREKCKSLELKHVDIVSAQGKSFAKKIEEALLSDMNTAKAMGLLWEALDSSEVSTVEQGSIAGMADAVFGLDLGKPLDDFVVSLSDDAEAILKKRTAAREQKNWAEADACRDQLEKLGYEILDDPKLGPTLRKK